MKHIIIFLLFTFSLNAQRDSTLQDYTYTDIDTFNLAGGMNRIVYTYYTGATSYTVTDTTRLTVASYIDSLISVNQNDSISTTAATDFYFRKYSEANTILQAKRNFLTKLWAIKP